MRARHTPLTGRRGVPVNASTLRTSTCGRARAMACRMLRAAKHEVKLLALLRARGRTQDGSDASGQWSGWEERAPPRRAPEDRPRVAQYGMSSEKLNRICEHSRCMVELLPMFCSLLPLDRPPMTGSTKHGWKVCVQSRQAHMATFFAAPTEKARPRMRRERVELGVLDLCTNPVDLVQRSSRGTCPRFAGGERDRSGPIRSTSLAEKRVVFRKAPPQRKAGPLA